MKNRIVCFLFIIFNDVFGQSSQYVREIALLDNNEHLQNTLANILTPRVVGTPEHDRVATFIRNELNTLGFETEVDSFVESTPVFGNLTFSNIIGTINSDAQQFLALSCHYDSKYFQSIPDFLGATDSAVPCALMLNIAKVLLPYIQQIKGQNNFGLKLIFFDGEEAFLEWTHQDSVYGSRHLAQKWANSAYQVPNTNQMIRNIDRIEVLVLLDLIGAQNAKFSNYYRRTQSLHNQLVKIERSLAKAGLLSSNRYMFFKELTSSRIDDDHRPFHEQNVPILHLISSPFPPQWHTRNDDAEHLHWPSIYNFNRIFRVFVYQYLTARNGNFNFRSIADF